MSLGQLDGGVSPGERQGARSFTAGRNGVTHVGCLLQAVGVRSAYKVRAYPDPEQAAVLNRTFGCVRVVWNRTLAARQARYATEHKSTS